MDTAGEESVTKTCRIDVFAGERNVVGQSRP